MAEKKVVKTEKTKLPEPGEKKPEVERVELDVTPKLSFNKDTVLYLLYLQYKSNMITRTHLKSYFQLINSDHPEDIAKWLVEEAAKG